jgi:hypothetical protein
MTIGPAPALIEGKPQSPELNPPGEAYIPMDQMFSPDSFQIVKFGHGLSLAGTGRPKTAT